MPLIKLAFSLSFPCHVFKYSLDYNFYIKAPHCGYRPDMRHKLLKIDSVAPQSEMESAGFSRPDQLKLNLSTD